MIQKQYTFLTFLLFSIDHHHKKFKKNHKKNYKKNSKNNQNQLNNKKPAITLNLQIIKKNLTKNHFKTLTSQNQLVKELGKNLIRLLNSRIQLMIQLLSKRRARKRLEERRKSLRRVLRSSRSSRKNHLKRVKTKLLLSKNQMILCNKVKQTKP